MTEQLLREHLLAIGAFATSQGYLKGLGDLNAGLAFVALCMVGLFAGVLVGARIIVPGHAVASLLLTVMWTVLGFAFVAARELAHIDGPGPVASLGTFVLGLMLSATHFVLKTSWQVSLLVLAICSALGGLFAFLLLDGFRLLNAI